MLIIRCAGLTVNSETNSDLFYGIIFLCLCSQVCFHGSCLHALLFFLLLVGALIYVCGWARWSLYWKLPSWEALCGEILLSVMLKKMCLTLIGTYRVL
uniref:Uncharacterized protein n=1 Tax=Arundo donax TaxID=35708 RepID=A0A0A8Y2L3_ARUDO